MTTIFTVIGARPQFIKAAPVSSVLCKSGIDEILVHTGQHYDDKMSALFFDELNLSVPDYNLDVGSGSHAYQTAQMLMKLEPLMCKYNPDWVLVYGDTNSTLAGALAAAKLNLKIAHVEAGLRSYNRDMPEEVNRIIADRLSARLFAPTKVALNNLLNEGVSQEDIIFSGDVMYDAALIFAEKAKKQTTILQKFALEKKRFVLATIHRAENTDSYDRLQSIIFGLNKVSMELPVVIPLHPRTKKAMASSGIGFNDNIHVIEPVGYLDMISLTSSASVVATDSGGLQKEAYFHRVPCVTLRDETEWTELIDSGWNTLAPPVTSETISSEIVNVLSKPLPSSTIQDYGDGKAAEKIVNHLV